MARLYPGRIPSNVNRDAKYAIVSARGGRMEVRLIYRASARERELLTTDRHEEVVEMVNSVKVEKTGQPGGAFYINEYYHVVVPTARGDGCYYGGTYENLLVFDYEGTLLSPRAPKGLRPGDLWRGPHVGISYTLAAGGNDIKYESKDGRHRTEHRLSDHVSNAAAAAIAHRLRSVKGFAGGRIYINEVGEFFAPLGGESGAISYLYLGHLEDDQWFPLPDVDHDDP